MGAVLHPYAQVDQRVHSAIVRWIKYGNLSHGELNDEQTSSALHCGIY